MLIRHEGNKLKPYRDHRGYLTIGVGRNLDANGISDRESFMMLHNDVSRTRHGLDKYIPWYKAEADPVRLVLENMGFQLGIYGLMQFERTIAAIRRRDYVGAAKEMLDSKWAEQTPRRAQELSAMMANLSASSSASLDSF